MDNCLCMFVCVTEQESTNLWMFVGNPSFIITTTDVFHICISVFLLFHQATCKMLCYHLDCLLLSYFLPRQLWQMLGQFKQLMVQLPPFARGHIFPQWSWQKQTCPHHGCCASLSKWLRAMTEDEFVFIHLTVAAMIEVKADITSGSSATASALGRGRCLQCDKVLNCT